MTRKKHARLHRDAEKLAALALREGDIQPGEKDEFIARHVQRVTEYPAEDNTTRRKPKVSFLLRVSTQ
jgi:hypothetical protein